MRSHASLAVIVLFIAVVACSNSDQEPSTHSFRIFEEDGIEVAETTGGAKYSNELFYYEEIIRLKEDESVEESLLTNPIWMMMDEKGLIYVIDLSGGRDGRILVYTLDGKFSHTIGQGGEGPGEYRFPQIMKIQNDVISVYDFLLKRISLFSREGVFQELVTCPPGQSGMPTRATIDSDDNLIMIYQVMDQSQDVFRHLAWKAVVVSTTGDTLSEIETSKTITGLRIQEGGRSYQAPAFFTGGAQIEYLPSNHIIVLDGIEPVIQWFMPNGRLTGEYRLGLEAGPVTDEDRAPIVAYFNSEIENAENEGAREYQQIAQRNIYYPDQKAHWDWCIPEESGYLWLRNSSPHSERDIFFLISPEGEYLGRSVTPSTGGTISQGHYLQISEDDETGEYQLIVYKLHPAVSGLSYPN